MLKKKNINLCILTNGSLINNSSLSIIQLVDSIIISVDSLNQIKNEEIRKGSCNYDYKQILDNIPQDLRKRVIIRSVMSKKNSDDILNMKNVVNNLGFKHVSSILIPNCLCEIDDVPLNEIMHLRNEYPNLEINDFINCGGCTREISIDADGSVYPCQNLMLNKFKITNILNNNWYEELSVSTITKQFQNLNVLKIEKCKDCNLKYACSGGCRAIAYKLYDGLDKNIEYFCEFLRKDALDRIKSIRLRKNEFNI